MSHLQYVVCVCLCMISVCSILNGQRASSLQTAQLRKHHFKLMVTPLNPTTICNFTLFTRNWTPSLHTHTHTHCFSLPDTELVCRKATLTHQPISEETNLTRCVFLTYSSSTIQEMSHTHTHTNVYIYTHLHLEPQDCKLDNEFRGRHEQKKHLKWWTCVCVWCEHVCACLILLLAQHQRASLILPPTTPPTPHPTVRPRAWPQPKQVIHTVQPKPDTVCVMGAHSYFGGCYG